MSADRLVQILAAVCLAIIAIMAGKPSFTNASQAVRGITDPGIALQAARNVQEVDDVLGDSPSADREVMRLKQYIDFAFIASYTSLSLAMAWLLWSRMRCAALGFAGCTLAAGVFDVRENLAILRLLPLQLSQTTAAAIRAIRAPGFTKWSLVSLAVVLLALFFLDSRRWFLRAVGVFDVAAGALTCWGIFHNQWLPWAAALISTALVLSAATLKLLTHESAP